MFQKNFMTDNIIRGILKKDTNKEKKGLGD